MSSDAFIRAEHLTEQEVCEILKIKPSTLASRRSCGTEHPPYIQIGKVRWYPKNLFLHWMSERPIVWDVKRIKNAS